MSDIRTEPAPPTVAPAADTPEMEHVDQYGNSVPEPVSGGYQINPNDPDKAKIIGRLKAKAPAEEGIVHSGAVDVTHEEPKAKTITSKPAATPTPAK